MLYGLVVTSILKKIYKRNILARKFDVVAIEYGDKLKTDIRKWWKGAYQQQTLKCRYNNKKVYIQTDLSFIIVPLYIYQQNV